MKRKSIILKISEVVLILTIVIVAISFTMNQISLFLERKNNEETSEEYWLPEESTMVLNILSSGQIKSSDISADTFAGISNIVTNCNFSSATVRTDVLEGNEPFGDVLIETGFDAVALAVPDASRLEKKGIEESLAYWNEKGIYNSGTNLSTDTQNSIKTIEVDGIKICYLSFTDYLEQELSDNENYLVNIFDERTPQIVEEASQKADVVIVTVYWNGENNSAPLQRQRQVAEILEDAGANIIVGVADNVIQPVEWIDGTLVFYSVGNLYSQSDELNERVGLLGAVTVTKTETGDKSYIELTNPKVEVVVSSEREIKYLSDVEDEAVEDYYNRCIDTIHMLDDSIRIGGIE